MNKYIFKTCFYSHSHERIKMFQMTVNSAVRHKPQEMQGPSVFLDSLHGLDKHFIGIESAGLNVTVYPGEILINYSARTDV